MTSLSGIEKFSNLEDKIYRTIEQCKSLRAEKERLEGEVEQTRREVGMLSDEKDRLEAQLERLYAERDHIRLKVEAMLEAIQVLESEVETARK